MKRTLLPIVTLLLVLTITGFSFASGQKEEDAEGEWSYLPAGPPLQVVVGPHTFMIISDA